MRIPKAREAVDKEWNKLEGKRAWLLETVREYSEVADEAKRKGETVHFGHVMQLCHRKHSQIATAEPVPKGRLVLRGDIVRDEDGYLAVFSEQGTSASHLAAAKFLDAIARMPGMDGEDSDAIGAYTQAEHVGPVTWVHLPKGPLAKVLARQVYQTGLPPAIKPIRASISRSLLGAAL